MYALLIHQITIFSACFITHITNIRALTTVFVCMRYQITLVTVCHITHIKNTRGLTTMYALMSYQIAPFTECLIAHFTRIWTLALTYIIGITAFITVYMQLFIQGTLVKNKS
jgi:hypothetical protein